MDKIITIGNTDVQHGKHNDRAYILSFSEDDGDPTIDMVELLARRNGYTKIIAKVPEERLMLFNKRQYIKEGSMSNDRDETFYFVAKYLCDKRKNPENLKEITDVIETAKNAGAKAESADFEIRPLTHDDISAQIAIYKQVFKSYPFPIYFDDYIKETMEDNVIYFGVFKDGEMIATSSADIDLKSGCAEMTDFATLEEHRGNGFAVSLLTHMENELLERGIKSFFTIARSVSYGMNKTFARCGYRFSGTLYNNTNINGTIESMNIWYKIAS